MSVFWKRTDSPSLNSHADWRHKIAKKNRRQGTSAPTLAAVWAGPVEVLGALRRLPVFDDFVLEQVVVERESRFDQYVGPRNHDLVVHGRLPGGDRVVVCIEAKAGETLGETVAQYQKAGQDKRERGEPTDAPERLEGLLKRYGLFEARAEERVRLMRYQLLSALAGTEEEAATAGAEHAVLMVHEFLTDQRPKDKTVKNTDDLNRFCMNVLNHELATGQPVPWCDEVAAPQGMTAKLYLAWAVSDFRSMTLEA